MSAFQAGAAAEDALVPVLARVYQQHLQLVVQQWMPGLDHPERINLTTLPAAVERMAVAANRITEAGMDRATVQRVAEFRRVNTSWLSLAALTTQYEADRTAGHPRHVLTWEAAARTVQRMTFQELPRFLATFRDFSNRPRPMPEATRQAAAAVEPERAYNGERLPDRARTGKKVKLPPTQKGVRYPPRDPSASTPGQDVPER